MNATQQCIRKSFLVLCLFFVVQGLFAHGAKDITQVDVENLESWQETFDLSDKKKGKYNILVKAKDLGGNIHIEGPHNISIDPDSDLPVCGITNPQQDMRIVGNLNIVGICVDDDAVDFVELILDGDTEDPVRATGKEFWSYYLDTSLLEEGPHTIEVRGTDINGLSGKSVKLSWNLDRRQPVTSMNEYVMVELVSGEVMFSGTVSDGNGIKSLAYSVDNGTTFKNLPLKDKGDSKEFAFSLDSKKFPDGPSVLWFKALDNSGSTGVYSFLYFIDNTPPEISIMSPAVGEPQCGKVGVVGIAKDILGISELQWTFGKESGSLDIVQGNPYWGIVFDTTSYKESSVRFTITGKDLVGNIVSASRTILLNQSLGKPTVTLTDPAPDTVIASGDDFFVRGIAKDSDGIQSIFYKLDGGKFIEEQTPGVFCVNLADENKILPGKHTVVVYAVDKNGAKSDSVSVNVEVQAASSDVKGPEEAEGEPSLDSPAAKIVITSPEPYSWVRKSLKITGTAYDPLGVKSGEYSVDGGETWKALSISSAAGGATFKGTEDLSNFADGIICLDVRIFNSEGQMTYRRTAVQRDTTPPSVEVIMPRDGAVVNGDNLIGFRVRDEGSLAKVYYNAPSGAKVPQQKVELPADSFVMTHVGTDTMPIDDSMSFDFVDEAGNITTVGSWKFIIDAKSDLPVAEIHLPTENEVITRDFTISGVVYDDDGASKIYYRIDNGNYIQLEGTSASFSIDVPFHTMLDNEHKISVYAVDINGVKGQVAERKFRISTEEPRGAMLNPSIDKAVKGVVTLSGTASDKNGIDKVFISIDNGNSYNLASGKEDWSYTFDTRTVPDGTQVVFLKIFDNYGIQGLYSTSLNIDNSAPEVKLDYPEDYAITTGPLFFSGYAFDNVDITEMFVTVRSLEGKSVPRGMQKVDFKLDRIVANTLDLSAMENGFYNVEFTASDKAGNSTYLSRNIKLDKAKPLAEVNLLYPLDGEHKQGNFNIYGQASAERNIESLVLYVDGNQVSETSLDSTGYFKFQVTSALMDTGVHKYRVNAKVEGGVVIKSREQTVDYTSYGPWVTVDNFNYGGFAANRPFISGHAGYAFGEDELMSSRMKNATNEQREAGAKKKVDRIEISFDNGKSFRQVSRNKKWSYRIENKDLPEGYHFMFVRATMKNGDVAIERCIIQIDNTDPTVRLIAPSPGGHYNQELLFSGLSRDDIELSGVSLLLRKGDKASYEVPAFIQGLYMDFSFWGATLYSIGAGLSFFDDNVKVQVQWGQFTQAQRNVFSNTNMRYGGDNVIGIKLIANVVRLPFNYFLGHDFDWLSANLAVGANFSRFNQTASGQPQILSAVFAQLEFPRISLENIKLFSTFAMYTEFSLWFIPTDISIVGGGGIKNLVPQISGGIRVNVF